MVLHEWPSIDFSLQVAGRVSLLVPYLSVVHKEHESLCKVDSSAFEQQNYHLRFVFTRVKLYSQFFVLFNIV